MIDFTDGQIAAREFRVAAYHEVGHKMLDDRFGGAGEAVIWENESRNPEETALEHGFDAPEPPANWNLHVGMAGLLAETS